MSFAMKKFREELAALLFTFNQHYQKFGWAPLAVTGAVQFPSFIEWTTADAARAKAWSALNDLDSEAASAAAKANVVEALKLSRDYYNGLYLLWRDYDKAVEAAYRAQYRKSSAPQAEMELAEVVG